MGSIFHGPKKCLTNSYLNFLRAYYLIHYVWEPIKLIGSLFSEKRRLDMIAKDVQTNSNDE